jgi:hypothetical protein
MATQSGEWLIQKYKAEAIMQHQVALHASPNPGPDPVRPEDIPIAPSSPYEKGKSPHKLAGLPASDRIRGALKPWTKGGDYDDEGGKIIDALKSNPALWKQIMKDAAAG